MEHSNHPHSFEPMNDELTGEPATKTGLDRRKFFKLFGGGLAVAFVLQDMFSFAGEAAAPGTALVPTSQVGAWIHIGEDGTVSVFTGKVEVGQNIRTSLSQIVAEELRVPISSIKMVMGDTDLVPFDAGTFGSRSTPQMGGQLRKAAATARQAMIDMAAKNWGAEGKTLQALDGMVINRETNKKITYSELTKGQQLLLPISDQARVTPANEWKVAGKTVKKINGQSFITGKHQYVSDMKLPGMLYGKILRAPSYNAKLVSVDIAKAQAIPGVVIVHDGDFVGIAAPSVRTAARALQAINAKWQETTQQPSNANIFEHLVKTASASGGRNAGAPKGDLEEGLKSADFTHSKTYNINYIAHVPLEPRAALAQWEDGKLTVWAGTQRPFGVQEDLADEFKIPKEKVRVIMPDTGSGYGGKHTAEAALEAARLALQAKKPVKVVWTREEEFTWAYFRPGGVIEVSSGVKKDGTISGWKFLNYNSGGSAINTQYKIANHEIAFLPSNTPLKQGSYRGLAATANVFARESHITDLARLIKMDQLEFRLKNSDDARLTAVLETAAKAFGWKSLGRATGHGYGIACGLDKGGYVATCAEVMVNSHKEVKVIRVTQAFECGAIVNPLHLENQIMGSIVQGLGGALFEAIDFADGKIRNSSLSAYRVPRFSDIPKIDIVMMDRKDLPSAGAGEAAIIGIAPAIRNAILDATGKGLTTLPLIPNGVLT
ncbi:MAG: isoquinoline 1-oxidoreductase [Segetibacter sp.]|nr:isoquinoline 1-oxidoreductase [Segetibacter sp.]